MTDNSSLSFPSELVGVSLDRNDQEVMKLRFNEAYNLDNCMFDHAFTTFVRQKSSRDKRS